MSDIRALSIVGSIIYELSICWDFFLNYKAETVNKFDFKLSFVL